VLSLLLIFVINKQAFGWTIQLYFTPAIYWQTLILVLTLSLAAAAYPAWRANPTAPGGDLEGRIN
jgi:putative ABC transport system permease protein